MSKFLDDWSDICADYEIGEDEKIHRVPKYMSDNIGNYVRTLQEYKNRKWELLGKLLRKEYRLRDSEQ